MIRKRIIAFTAVVAFLVFIIWLIPKGNADVSSIGFAGYQNTNGQRNLILVVTNNSSHRISQPDGNWKVVGESSNGAELRSGHVHTSCCFGQSGRRSWQLKPDVPSVAPGETFQFTIPVKDGSYTWHVTVPLRTIPFKYRLPYVLRSRWPSSKRDTPIRFQVTLPPIPPPPSNTASVGLRRSAWF